MLNPLKQIDAVFLFLKERMQHGGFYGYNNLKNHFDKHPELNITITLLQEILKRMVEDGYITKGEQPNSQPCYRLSFQGLLFDGYEKEKEKRDERAEWEIQTTKQLVKNGKTLNRLTWILVIGTSISAVYYLMEIFRY